MQPTSALLHLCRDRQSPTADIITAATTLQLCAAIHGAGDEGAVGGQRFFRMLRFFKNIEIIKKMLDKFF
jgi:hypothetical protein